MAGRFNRERAAAILADAALNGDRSAAQRWGVSEMTLWRYRRRLDSDASLLELVNEKKKALERAWIDRAAGALVAAAEFIERAAREADPRDPVAIHAVSGALKILNEAILTSQVIDARLAHTYRRNGTSDRTVVVVDPRQRHAANG